jgi:hypothetical protein
MLHVDGKWAVALFVPRLIFRSIGSGRMVCCSAVAAAICSPQHWLYAAPFGGKGMIAAGAEL